MCSLEVLSCWAGFRTSAGGSEPCTDKTGSAYHLCVVVSNEAPKQRTATFVRFISTAMNFKVRMPVIKKTFDVRAEVVSVSTSVRCCMCHIQVFLKKNKTMQKSNASLRL